MMNRPIYLDYMATTPVDAQVAKAMMEHLTYAGNFGNPSSRTHWYGWQAEAAVEQARTQVAELLQVNPQTIVWTSGATESNNLAIKGAAYAYRRQGNHIVTCQTEHRAVLDVCGQLEREGFEVTYLRPEPNGLLDLVELQRSLRRDTLLVSVMHVNNEIGVIQDVEAIGRITRAAGVLLHVDAAQSVGKLPINLAQLPIDLLSISAHKSYGPKGIGALYVRDKPRLHLQSLLQGGGQERGLRAGTLPVHQIVGMGVACALAGSQMAQEQLRLAQLTQRLWTGLRDVGNVQLNGDSVMRIPGNLNVSFAGMDAGTLMQSLPGLALSGGSACASGHLTPSHVLLALGLSESLVRSAIRFSLGRYTTVEEIDSTVEQIRQVLR